METQEEKHKKYIKEIKKIEHNYTYFDDPESYHYDWDNLLVRILKDNGYRDIAEMYEKALDDFSYCL